MANNSANVSVGKPNKTGGAVHFAVLGTTLPTDATTALDNAFKDLGYISEEGVRHNMERTSEDIKAWGGDVVLSPETEKSDIFTMKFIESLNVEVLKLVHGAANVTGTLATGIAISANSSELDYGSMAIDMLMTNGAKKRIVLPNCKVSNISEVSYVDNDAVGYEAEVKAFPDSSGNTHYEYIVKPE